MHPVLIEAGDDLVLIDAGFGPELPEMLVGRYELRREKNLMDGPGRRSTVRPRTSRA